MLGSSNRFDKLAIIKKPIKKAVKKTIKKPEYYFWFILPDELKEIIKSFIVRPDIFNPPIRNNISNPRLLNPAMCYMCGNVIYKNKFTLMGHNKRKKIIAKLLANYDDYHDDIYKIIVSRIKSNILYCKSCELDNIQRITNDCDRKYVSLQNQAFDYDSDYGYF
jgi:hypothetical protein